VKEAKMKNLEAGDVFEVAVQIEKHGERFYRHAASLTDDDKIKEVFNYTASEEAKHRKLFETMAEKVEADYKPPESYPGEYCSYVRAYSNNLVFPEDKIDEQFKGIQTVEEAVEFAIQKEIESILYYLEMKNFVPAAQRDEVGKIIEEERKHYLRLTELKRTIS
jgi:rubrerythrin